MAGTNRKMIFPDGMLTPFAKMTRLDKIAAGGFGDVYRAEHEDWGTVAYKKLPQSYIQPNDRAVRQMMREVEILKKLRHQNIVTITGVVFENGNYGIVLEFMFHGNADNFFVTFRVPVSWKVQLVYDVVLGMNYLHLLREPIIHGDLKIQNILVTNGYQAKISDFGLSSWKGVSKSSSRHADVAGTVTHISPERWNDVNVRPMEKEDIYAFGVLVWEMFTEQKPFPNLSNAVAIMLAVSKGQRPDVRQLPTDTPSLIRSLIESSWKNDPNERKSFKEIKLELDNFISSHEDDIRAAKHDILRQESMSSDSSFRMDGLSLTSLDEDQERDDSGNCRPRDLCQTAAAAAAAAAAAECSLFSSSVILKRPVSVRDNGHTGPSGSGGVLEDFPTPPPPHPPSPSLCFDKNLILTESTDPVDGAFRVVCPVQESEGKPSSVNPPLTSDPSIPQGVISLETNLRSLSPGSSGPVGGSQTLMKEIVAGRFFTSPAPLEAREDATDVLNPFSIRSDPYFCAEREKNGARQDVRLNEGSQRPSVQEEEDDSSRCGEPLNFVEENLRTVLNRPFSVPETDATLSPPSESESRKETAQPRDRLNSRHPQNQSIGSKERREKSNDLLKIDLSNWNENTELNNLNANKGYSPKDGDSFKGHAAQPVSSVAGLCGPVGQSGDNKTTHVACHEHHPQPLDCFSSCEGKGRQNSPEASRCGIGDILNSDSSGVQLNWQKNGKELTVFNASHVGPYVQFGDKNIMNVTALGDGSSVSPPPSASSSSGAKQNSSTQSKERTRKEKIIVPDRLVDRGIITIVAGSIGSDWARLARQLGLRDSDIGSYELDHRHLGVHEVAYEMLRDWTERNGSEAEVQLIAKALVAIKRPDVALKLSSCALAAHKQ